MYIYVRCASISANLGGIGRKAAFKPDSDLTLFRAHPPSLHMVVVLLPSYAHVFSLTHIPRMLLSWDRPLVLEIANQKGGAT